MKPILPLINITNEDDYRRAQTFMSELLDACKEKEDSPLNLLVEIIATAIDRYEEKDTDLLNFINKASGIPAHIATLNVLMDQYNLTRSDFPEIGNNTVVSQVLNGEKSLTTSAIEQLCTRFGLQTDYFNLS